MSFNTSQNPLNSASSSVLVEWRCFGGEKKILSLEDAFGINVHIYAFVNAVSAIFGLLSNSFVIFGAYQNRILGKLSKAFAIFLAMQGMLSAVVIQPFFVTAKFLTLANIHNPLNVSYCLLMLIVVYGTKYLSGLAIATMLGITVERYMAVIHPHQYKAFQQSLLKLLVFSLVIISAHFALSDTWAWYKNISKILTALLTFVPYIFTVYAYVKIYLKLGHLDEVRSSSNANTGTPAHRNNKKKMQSLTSFIVVGSYLVCYLPMIMIRALKLDETSLVVKMYVRPWATTLLLSLFSVNALLYGWRSAKISFRKAVDMVLRSEAPQQ